jgi:hypothetical protein
MKWRVRLVRHAPERYRDYVFEHFDATAGPPPGADPVAPDVVWVKEDSVAGGDFPTAAWHRWTLTPDRRQVRRFELVAYVAPPVPA